MLILYEILYIISMLCYLPIFLVRGKYHRGFLMRLGIFPQGVINKIKDGQRVIWLHTVSVGETQAAAGLVKNLRETYPDVQFVISTVTKTGNQIAESLTCTQDLVIYLPLDIGFIVRKVINLLNPSLFIVAETEIWPNLIINLAKKDIPIVLINGRVSSGSFKGYKLIRPFIKKAIQKFFLLCMQTESDAQRIIELGAPKDKVKITGNMKFDIKKPETSSQKPDFALTEEEKLFIAGSTHRGEEKIILQVYKELLNSHSNLRLLIAPRHIERTEEVEGLVARFGFKSQRVSQVNKSLQLKAYNLKPVLVLDTVGQLKGLYALADIVFVGGSFIPHGGQNPIEPALFSKPVLFGPYMFNFSDIKEAFLNKKAALEVRDSQQLKDICLRILEDSRLSKELGEQAQEVVMENRGSTLRNLELIEGLLSTKSGRDWQAAGVEE